MILGDESASFVSCVVRRSWGNFILGTRFLLVSSIWNSGVRKYLKLRHDSVPVSCVVLSEGFGNTLLSEEKEGVFLPERIFDYYLGNASEILKLVDDSYVVLSRISDVKLKIESAILQDDFVLVCDFVRLLLDLFLELSFFKYLIKVLAVETIERGFAEEFSRVLSSVEAWRNDQRFYSIEEFLIDVAFYFCLKKNFAFDGLDVVRYLHLDEFLYFVHEGLDVSNLAEKIKMRRDRGYVLLDVCDYFCNEVLEFDSVGFEDIVAHVGSFYCKRGFDDKDNFSGIPICSDFDDLVGECVLVKSVLELRDVCLNGKILVTSMTTPRFVPYLEKGVSGIVTDNGGALCHAAIIAREFNIPCIVGAQGASSFFRNGDLIKMDFKTGIIERL